jgi:beta-galactosidase
MPKIQLDERSILLDGRRVFLFCSSLFYFRIPRELWRDRMRTIRAAGYNCIDAYFPWNHHELSPGEWDFSGERDIGAFLTAAKESGLFVLARPGPYICSEWDGGAIPAWVLADCRRIRQADEEFLSRVEEWYSRVIPILAARQYTRGGAIILLQIENELDFFDCPDPGRYLGELRRLAEAHGIDVPVFACAGQGKIERATAPGVRTMFNVYFKGKDPRTEEVCLAAGEYAGSVGCPLMISETLLDPLVLRRELSSGAKLIGAYNQVGGTNFGFTNGINNWGVGGNPLSFIASDYDFSSLLSAAGETNNLLGESRLIGDLIDSLGESLAAAVVERDHGFSVKADFPLTDAGPMVLRLGRGGFLICVSNIGDAGGYVAIGGPGAGFTAYVGPGEAPFFPIEVPLRDLGIEGVLLWSSAEIGRIRHEDGRTSLLLYSDCGGSALLSVPGAESISGAPVKDGLLSLQGSAASALFRIAGRNISVSITDRATAGAHAAVGSTAPCARVRGRRSVEYRGPVVLSSTAAWPVIKKGVPVGPLERNGLWRGFGEYLMSADPRADLLLKGVGDVVSAYSTEVFLGTRISGGQWQRYTAPPMSDGTWRFRTEIWGHSNFDDPRLPNLRLTSLRGIESAFQVMWEKDITSGWFFEYFDEEADDGARAAAKRIPFWSVNSWNGTRVPMRCSYSKRLTMPANLDAAILSFEGNKAMTEVLIDGNPAGRVNPLDPYIDLSSHVAPGRDGEIRILANKRDWAEPVGTVRLLGCVRISTCDLSLLPDRALTAILDKPGRDAGLPIRIPPGAMKVATFNLDGPERSCSYARFFGKDMKLTAVFNGRVVGRIFLDSSAAPAVVGGDPLIAYLPGPWRKPSGNALVLLLEGIGEAPSLDRLLLEYPAPSMVNPY